MLGLMFAITKMSTKTFHHRWGPVSEKSFHDLSAQNKVLPKWQNKKEWYFWRNMLAVCKQNCCRCILEYWCGRMTTVIISFSELTEHCAVRTWHFKNCKSVVMRLSWQRAHQYYWCSRSRWHQRKRLEWAVKTYASFEVAIVYLLKLLRIYYFVLW